MSSVLRFNGPWRITFDTNPDDCNFQCIMCEENSLFGPKQRGRENSHGGKRRMEVGIIQQVIEECDGNGLKEIIPSTMGEPLLYGHFDEILSICYERGLLLNLTTNGSFPRKSASEWAERICPIASDVKISWNGATPETQEEIMIGSDFEVHLNKIRDFISIRDEVAESGHFCRVTLQLTFMERNLEEIPGIIRLAAELGVNRVKGHHLWVNFPEMENQSLRRSTQSINRWNARLPEIFKAAEQHRLPNGRTAILDNFFPLTPGLNEMVKGSVCPFLGKEAWINQEGRFDPCCAPDELRKTLGYFGNVTETPFRRLWMSTKYRNLRKYYAQIVVCSSCNMRRPPGRC